MLQKERLTRVARGISTRITNANNAVEVETPLNWKCLDHSRLRLKLDGQRLWRGGGEVGGGVWFGLLVFIFFLFGMCVFTERILADDKNAKYTREGPKKVKMESVFFARMDQNITKPKNNPNVITCMPHHLINDNGNLDSGSFVNLSNVTKNTKPILWL